MIPPLIASVSAPWPVLPAGIHPATLEEVKVAFATNHRRRQLYLGLVDGVSRLRRAGCETVYLDGSYVTAKPRPNDFDACWDPQGVDEALLDPLFRDFRNGRSAQKSVFQGEFFPSSMECLDVGKTFIDFFQLERFTGKKKGIILISLLADPVLLRKEPKP